MTASKPSLHVAAPDPFAVFGLPRELDLEARALERRYLDLSRECHPDRNRAQNTADCAAVLLRAAEINDAWRVLRDPWQRARALLRALDPTALERNQRLPTLFLADALERAEAVALASAEQVPALRDECEQLLRQTWNALATAFAERKLDAAATLLQQANYHSKALADLDSKS